MITIPVEILNLYQVIKKKTDHIYFVGGVVRNFLLGLEVVDYDLASDLLPDDLCDLLKQNNYQPISTNKKYGTISVFLKEFKIEITTFRKEIDYINRRFPVVEFETSLEEDLNRRDFTINALAYHLDWGIIDPFSGKVDLENKLIRAVGDPTARFKEDSLRLLRAIRFATILDFNIEENTFLAIKNDCHLIEVVSNERIVDELRKIFASTNFLKGFYLLKQSGLLDIIFPFKYNENVVNSADYLFNLASLFFLIDEVDLSRFKLTNNEKKMIKLYCQCYQLIISKKEDKYRRAIGLIGINFNYFALYFNDDKLKEFYHLTKQLNHPVTRQDLALSSLELLEYATGEVFGLLQQYLFEQVLKDPSLNDKNTLKNLIENYFSVS